MGRARPLRITQVLGYHVTCSALCAKSWSTAQKVGPARGLFTFWNKGCWQGKATMHYLLIEGKIKERERAHGLYIIYDIQMQFNPCRQSEHCEVGAAFWSPRVCRAPKEETLK